jgi:hypothetical protein
MTSPLICEKISPTIANNRQQSPTAKAERRGHTLAPTIAEALAASTLKRPVPDFFSSFLFLIHSWFEHRIGSRWVHVPGERDFQRLQAEG